MSDFGKFVAIAGFVLILLCFAGYGIGVVVGAIPQFVDGDIDMVQPCGQIWCADKDAHYAGKVNKPNSEANQNNAQANLYNAQATLTVAEANERQAYAANTYQSKYNAFLSGMCLPIIFLGLGAIVAFGVAKQQSLV